MPIPLFDGLKVFFKTRRYVAYLTVFVATTFLALFVSYIITKSVGSPLEEPLVNFFVYVGATGAIYFGVGTLLALLKLDRLWITSRGRGRITEMKGLSWMAVSFAIAVFISIGLGRTALYFFAVFGWLGWIAFQAYLSARTSLRLATIAEPKKGGVVIGLGSFIILLIGIGLIAGEALAALWLIPSDFMGIGTTIVGIFPKALTNLTSNFQGLIVAYLMMGLFALVSLLAFFRYAARGAALNVALLTVFISLYAGYFLVNVMRREGPPQMNVVDIVISIFFLAYAMSGIGRTVTESVEESRARLRDLGPLLTFFLASGFFFVDSIIAISATPGSIIGQWFNNDWVSNAAGTYLFKDIAKLTAFPLGAIFASLFYLRRQRVERVVEKVKESGETLEPRKVDKEIAERMPAPGEAWPSERAEGIKKGKPGYDLSTPPPGRLSVDSSKRLKPGKRLGEEDEEEEKKK